MKHCEGIAFSYFAFACQYTAPRAGDANCGWSEKIERGKSNRHDPAGVQGLNNSLDAFTTKAPDPYAFL